MPKMCFDNTGRTRCPRIARTSGTLSSGTSQYLGSSTTDGPRSKNSTAESRSGIEPSRSTSPGQLKKGVLRPSRSCQILTRMSEGAAAIRSACRSGLPNSELKRACANRVPLKAALVCSQARSADPSCGATRARNGGTTCRPSWPSSLTRPCKTSRGSLRVSSAPTETKSSSAHGHGADGSTWPLAIARCTRASCSVAETPSTQSPPGSPNTE